MDVRIGVIQSPREIVLELDDSTDRAALKQRIAELLAEDDEVLVLADKKGREVLVPTAKIAYVELSGPEAVPRIGFGA